MPYWPATVDIHRGDPHWDYDEQENPYPGTEYLAHAALIRSMPAQRVAVGQSSKETTK